MKILKWFVLLVLWITSACTFTFPLWQQAEEPKKTISKDLPEEDQGWLQIVGLCAFLVVLVYVIINLRGHSAKNKDQPSTHRQISTHRHLKKKRNTSRQNKSVDKVQNRKVNNATVRNRKLQGMKAPAGRRKTKNVKY